ncbi:MAG TPA: CehA/McbA family metallohydrolase, partial [Abditibacteriaceae bacterium]
TEGKPDFDGSRQATFPIYHYNGDWHEYTVPFESEEDLTRLRLDVGGRAGNVEISWIELANVNGLEAPWVEVPVAFHTQPSQPTLFQVRDEHGKPTMAAFIIRDEQGRVYPTQAKRLAPDFFFQPQIYRRDGESVRLPAGRYQVTCSRGPESVPEVQTLVVGIKPAKLSYQVRRWIDPSRRGWWSGDHHIHAAGCQHYSKPTEGVLPQDMARHIQGEDLKVGANLTWGPGFDHQKQFFSGKEDKVSLYPYLLRYDVEVSGFGSHESGHLCLLRLKNQIYPGGDSYQHWPTLGLNTLRWAKKQGAVCGPAHSANGLTNLTSQRVASRDGPNGLPSYAIPAYDGIGANECIVDVTHEVPGPDGSLVPAVDFISSMDTDRKAEWNIWYHVLNCGFRTRVSGETDFPCISGERVGLGRVYVKQKGRLTYDGWCEGIRAGRSYVSDGYHHLMDFAVNPLNAAGKIVAGKTVLLGEQNSEVRLARSGRIRLSAFVAARNSRAVQVPVEVVMNGYPIARKLIPADGKERQVTFEVGVPYSSWVALRIFPQAHTNPIFLIVKDKPIRSSRRSAEWCLRGVDQCWSQKQRFYRAAEQDDAKQAYNHARQVYQRILKECVAD